MRRDETETRLRRDQDKKRQSSDGLLHKQEMTCFNFGQWILSNQTQCMFLVVESNIQFVSRGKPSLQLRRQIWIGLFKTLRSYGYPLPAQLQIWPGWHFRFFRSYASIGTRNIQLHQYSLIAGNFREGKAGILVTCATEVGSRFY